MGAESSLRDPFVESSSGGVSEELIFVAQAYLLISSLSTLQKASKNCISDDRVIGDTRCTYAEIGLALRFG